MLIESRCPALPELFENIAHQFYARLIHPQDVGEALREKIGVEGESLEQLLQEWVRALIDLVQVQHMVFGRFHVTALQTPEKGPHILQAEVLGELFDPQRHNLRTDTSTLKCGRVVLRKEGKEYYAEIQLAQ
jgi:SHS2 domain-containing protein